MHHHHRHLQTRVSKSPQFSSPTCSEREPLGIWHTQRLSPQGNTAKSHFWISLCQFCEWLTLQASAFGNRWPLCSYNCHRHKITCTLLCEHWQRWNMRVKVLLEIIDIYSQQCHCVGMENSNHLCLYFVCMYVSLLPPPPPHHNHFTAFLPGPPGWAGARRELLDFMVQGKTNRGRHTDHPAGCHSIWTKQCPPPPSPIFYRPDALPATQPTVSKHWMQLAHSD